jgi:hypothetical protein
VSRFLADIIDFDNALGSRSGLRRFDQGHDLVKDLWMYDCQFAQRFSIQLDPGQMQPVNELGIRNPSFATGGRQTNDPQLSKHSLANASVTERICARTNDSFFDGSQQLAATTDIPPSFLEQTLLRATTSFSESDTHNSVFRPGHERHSEPD